MQIRNLRHDTHPDLNDYVVHFTGRGGPSNRPPAVEAMSPLDRLVSILDDQAICAYPMFGMDA
jgi:hypothetical protein